MLGLFRIHDIAAAATAAAEGGSRNRLLLLDQTAPAAEQVLYPRDLSGRQDDMLAGPGVASDVVVGGRVWRIVILPPEGDGSTRLRLSDLVLASGLLLTLNLGIYVLLGMRHLGAAEHKHKLLDKALRQSQERLTLATTRHVSASGIGTWRRTGWYGTRGCTSYTASGRRTSAVLTMRGRRACTRRTETGDAAIKAAINRVMDFNIEFRVIWPNGEVHNIEAHALVQRQPDGCATRMVGVNWDITDRERATEIIRRQADQYATMLATTSDGFFLLDQRGTFLAANDAYSRMTDYSGEELLKLTIKDVEVIETAETTRDANHCDHRF